MLAVASIFLVGAAPGGESWEGTFEAGPVRPPECASPVGICTHGMLYDARTGKAVATYDFTMLTMTTTGSGTEMAFTGWSVITKLSGAPGKLFADDEGTFKLTANSRWRFVTRVHIVGGTEAYVGATGLLTATGELDSTNGATWGTYTGTIRH